VNAQASGTVLDKQHAMLVYGVAKAENHVSESHDLTLSLHRTGGCQ